MSAGAAIEPIEQVAIRIESYFSDCMRADLDDLFRLEKAGILKSRKALKQDVEESGGEFERGELIFDWTEGGLALLQQARWKQIDTAPKDGTHFLACNATRYGPHWGFNQDPPTVVHYWDIPGEEGFYTSVNERAPEQPFPATHWRPLGAPPQL